MASTTTAPIAATTSTGPSGSTSTTPGTEPPAASIPFIQHAASSPPDGVSPAGSGCRPPRPTVLPDGRWFGELKTVAPDAGTLGLDVACFYGGSAANAAAKAAGQHVPVPNDIFISNTSPNVLTLHAVSDVAVGLLGANGSAVAYYPTKTGLEEATPVMSNWVWVDVASGWVVAIQQQYIP